MGLKSTALLFREKTKPLLVLIYGLCAALLLAAGWTAGGGIIFLAGWAATALHFAWQITTLDVDDQENCLKRFRSNHAVGAIVFIAVAFENLVRAGL